MFAYFTDMKKMIDYTSKYPEDIFALRILNDLKKPGEKFLPPVTGFYLLGTPGLVINSCALLEDLYVTKNAFFSKHPMGKMGGKPLFTDNLLTLETDNPKYKQKRKAISGAFFKSKMSTI